MGSLATKEDLARVEGALKRDLALVQGKIALLEEKVDGLSNALMLRLGGIVIVVVGLAVAVLRLWE